MKRCLFLFATLLLLWTIGGLLNDALSAWRMYTYLGGLLVTFAAVAAGGQGGLWAVVLIGAVCDAHSPLPFGTQALLFAVAHALVQRLKDRLPYDDAVGRVALALLCNLGLFLVLSFLRAHRAPSPGAFWARDLGDLAISQAAIVAIGPWFFALQERVLAYAGP